MSSAPDQTDRQDRSEGPDPSLRVRFAPSPTGALHIGGARTALFNWLLARHAGGKLVLRIEDTDRERSTPENVEQILDALRWLQLDWDEGPILQTQRSERHQQALQALLDAGRAYRSSATADHVKAYKQLHGAERGFRGEAEAEGAVRLRVPDEGETVVHDAIRGDTSFAHVHLDDPVIARADGSVLYNFAVAIDDLDARITHVVRGEDHLSNTPKQLLVLEAARAAGFDGADRPLPVYAHLPLLHGPDGKKLSKRHGAASVQELRDAGYLPAAVRNYLALLGWGAGDDQTVLSTDELVERFALQRVSRNPARFDETKLKWLNGVHIRALAVEELAVLEGDFLDEVAGHPGVRGDERFVGAVAISQEKIHTLADFWPLTGFIFAGPSTDPAAREKWLGEDGLAVLADVRAALAELANFDQAAVQAALEGVLERLGCKPRSVYQPVRVAISGTTISPGIFESVALLGREETLRRIDAALAGGR
jgi:glutamyl-tRNA synthetase